MKGKFSLSNKIGLEVGTERSEHIGVGAGGRVDSFLVSFSLYCKESSHEYVNGEIKLQGEQVPGICPILLYDPTSFFQDRPHLVYNREFPTRIQTILYQKAFSTTKRNDSGQLFILY